MSNPNTPSPFSTVGEDLAVLTSIFDTFQFTIGKGPQSIQLNGQEVITFVTAIASLFKK